MATIASDPTTRSRTLLFISYRDSQARASRYARSRRTYGHIDDDGGDEAQRLIRDDASHPDADTRLDIAPIWLDIADQVEAAIVDTRNKTLNSDTRTLPQLRPSFAIKVFALDKLHAKHVLPGFKDRSNEEHEIEVRTNEITREFRRCHSLIQRISASTSSHTFPPNIPPSQNDVTSAQNVQRALAAKVQELSALFRTKQRVYMQKLQGHAISRNDQMIASGVLPSNPTNTYDSLQQDEEASRSQLSAMQQSDPSLASRNHEIAEIAKSIVQLAELFKDLSNLVIDQGTILDSVEYNIQQTAIHMEDAVKELDIATQYQRNTGRRKCIFLLLLIIFGLVLVLIFKPRKRSPPPLSDDSSVAARILYVY
ncbi:SNARE affecting a late Golgi compartment protein 2 [Ceratobasidium sp. AG-Ba]|nr:SNARE affecting a late Golgi compartment protein 2 [Ceratobasidium sp. AG-Ba]QRW08380.1 SNARE affecting a late Golgi compartment protein 2 [Ceratobasidium sp. AG-Ba]